MPKFIFFFIHISFLVDSVLHWYTHYLVDSVCTRLFGTASTLLREITHSLFLRVARVTISSLSQLCFTAEDFSRSIP